MEPILSGDDRDEVKKMLDEALTGDVEVHLYTRHGSIVLPGEEPNEHGPIAEQLLGEVAALSPLIKLTVHDAATDPEPAKAAGLEGIDPAITFTGAGVKGKLRYLGLPAGYEFRTLIDTLIAVSRSDSGLSAPARAAVAGITKPVHLEVFVTPT